MTSYKLYHNNVERKLTIGKNGFKYENYTKNGDNLADTIVFFKELTHVDKHIKKYTEWSKYTFKYNDKELDFGNSDDANEVKNILLNELEKNKIEIDIALGIE